MPKRPAKKTLVVAGSVRRRQTPLKDAFDLTEFIADARKGIPMKEALAAEILEAYQGQGNAIRKRDEVHKMAQANKAFAHFRW